MDKITGQVDWTPVNRRDNTPAPTLDILLGVNSRLQEILLTSILASTHHRVHVVDSGQMAIQSLNQQPFNLILLSYDMPELTAIETTKKIRNSPEGWSQIPLVGLLENQAPLMIAECLCAGMNSFICTPFSSNKILSLATYYQEKLSTNI